MKFAVSMLMLGALAAPATVHDADPVSTASGVRAPVQFAGPPSGAFDRNAVIDKLAQELEQRYLFPEIGSRYANALRNNRAAGRYNVIGDREQFAAQITQDLQSVHVDQHVRLVAASPGEQNQRRAMGLTGSGIKSSQWLADGVGYMAFTMFSGNPAALDELQRAIDQFSSARTLILDLRENRGGGRAEMDLLLSNLFAEETELLQTDTRMLLQLSDGTADATGVVRPVPGPPGLRREAYYAVPAKNGPKLTKPKVIVLTSGRTASAAEHFALALKRTGRATIVGEPTRGAGHFGMPVAVGDGFFAFIPFGRTFDPTTGRSWEGTGVKPDIEVPADEALQRALELTRLAKSRNTHATERWAR